MRVIVLSNEGSVEYEQEQVVGMFKGGLTNFHLSKPDFNSNQLREYLKGIPKEFRKYIVVHGYEHKDLIKEFGLKGLHINSEERRKQYFTGTRASLLKLANPGIYLSTAFNSLKSLKKTSLHYDYLVLNNIFKSRSKKVFKSHFDWTEIEKTLHNLGNKRVIASGGISDKKMPTLKNLGFSGVLVKSAIWEAEDPVQAFQRTKEAAKYAKRQSFYNYNY